MEMISKALVDGHLQAIGEETGASHRAIAKALVDIGGHRQHPPGNRAERRRAKALAKRARRNKVPQV